MWRQVVVRVYKSDARESQREKKRGVEMGGGSLTIKFIAVLDVVRSFFNRVCSVLPSTKMNKW